MGSRFSGCYSPVFLDPLGGSQVFHRRSLGANLGGSGGFGAVLVEAAADANDVGAGRGALGGELVNRSGEQLLLGVSWVNAPGQSI